jgi:nickel-dependent lactate racemase
VHEVHTAEQPFREASFDLNQVATHLEAVAAKAKAKVAAMRKLAADASAAHEAAVHVVPAEPTVGSFIGAAVDAAVYTAKAGMRAVGLA